MTRILLRAVRVINYYLRIVDVFLEETLNPLKQRILDLRSLLVKSVAKKLFIIPSYQKVLAKNPVYLGS